MLYANINPTAKTVKQIDPFTTEIQESNYMTVIATNYGAGAEEVKFCVIFGVITDNSFYKNFEINTVLTAQEFSSWGSDDSILLQIVSNKIGTEITSYITTDLGDQLI